MRICVAALVAVVAVVAVLSAVLSAAAAVAPQVTGMFTRRSGIHPLPLRSRPRAGATGAAEAGSAEAEAVAELREGHAVAMAEHQREVEMLVGSLRVSALRNLLGHAQCKEGCSLERAVRAWRQAAAGRL